MKKCSTCGIEKENGEFYKSKITKDELQYRCKNCSNANAKVWRLANLEKVRARHRAWYKANPERARELGKAWRLANPERVNASRIKRYLDNPEKLKAIAKAWRLANPVNPKKNRARVRAWRLANPEKRRAWENNSLKINIQFKLSKYLRTRLRIALKRNRKAGSAVKDLGCTVPELIIHLENQFTKGMTWKNHGEWHIDHIVPLSSFDLTNREQLLRACHYTNLQPLWAFDNISKGDKILPLDFALVL